MRLNPGTYTAVLRGESDGTGIGLIEVYDLESTGGARLGNISTRGNVGNDDRVVIGGIILRGNNIQKVVARDRSRSRPQRCPGNAERSHALAPR